MAAYNIIVKWWAQDFTSLTDVYKISPSATLLPVSIKEATDEEFKAALESLRILINWWTAGTSY